MPMTSQRSISMEPILPTAFSIHRFIRFAKGRKLLKVLLFLEYHFRLSLKIRRLSLKRHLGEASRSIAPRRLALAQPFPQPDWFLIRPYPIRLDFNATEYGLIPPRRLEPARPFPQPD
jgi:hypothetical protein